MAPLRTLSQSPILHARKASCSQKKLAALSANIVKRQVKRL
jgi:hypothetical protein